MGKCTCVKMAQVTQSRCADATCSLRAVNDVCEMSAMAKTEVPVALLFVRVFIPAWAQDLVRRHVSSPGGAALRCAVSDSRRSGCSMPREQGRVGSSHPDFSTVGLLLQLKAV